MLPAHCQPPSTFWKAVRTESVGPWLSQAVVRLVSARPVFVSVPQTQGAQGTPSKGVCLSRGAVWERRARRAPEHLFLWLLLLFSEPSFTHTVSALHTDHAVSVPPRRPPPAAPGRASRSPGAALRPRSDGFERRHNRTPRSLVSRWPCKGRAVLHKDMVTVLHQLRELHSYWIGTYCHHFARKGADTSDVRRALSSLSSPLRARCVEPLHQGHLRKRPVVGGGQEAGVLQAWLQREQAGGPTPAVHDGACPPPAGQGQHPAK